MFSSEFCEISKKIFFYRTPLVAASITWILLKVTLEFHVCNTNIIFRGGSRAAATSKMEWFMTIVNGWKSLTIIAKLSILDVAAALDPPLILRQRTMMIIFDETQIDTGYLWYQGCYMNYFKKQNEILWLWFPKILQVLVLRIYTISKSFLALSPNTKHLTNLNSSV